MRKEWYRRAMILALAAVCAAFYLLLASPGPERSTGTREPGSQARVRLDSTAVTRDSLHREESDQHMREYARKHPAAVREKY